MFWILLWLATAVAQNETSWNTVCNTTAKTCGLHSLNDGFNDIGLFLNPGSPFFGTGYTLYINPFPNVCVDQNCSGPIPAQFASCTYDDIEPGILIPWIGCRPEGSVNDYRVQWDLGGSLKISTANITIRSYYSDYKVLFTMDTASANQNRINNQPVCNVFTVLSKSVSFMMLEFQLPVACAQAATNAVTTDLVPIRYIGVDASNSTLSELSATGAVAVVQFAGTSASILTSNVVLDALVNEDPPDRPITATIAGLPLASTLAVLASNFRGNIVMHNMGDAYVFHNAILYRDGSTLTLPLIQQGTISGTFTGFNASVWYAVRPKAIGCPDIANKTQACAHSKTTMSSSLIFIIVISSLVGLILLIGIAKCITNCIRKKTKYE